MRLSKGFDIKVNGLAKSFSRSSVEVETKYGYTDLLCKMEAISTVLVDDEYIALRVYAEVYDGVVINLKVSQSKVHKQLESFLGVVNTNDVSNTVNSLLDDINCMIDTYVYERDYAFVESVMAIVLNLNSYDSDTCLYNKETYNLAHVA